MSYASREYDELLEHVQRKLETCGWEVLTAKLPIDATTPVSFEANDGEYKPGHVVRTIKVEFDDGWISSYSIEKYTNDENGDLIVSNSSYKSDESKYWDDAMKLILSYVEQE